MGPLDLLAFLKAHYQDLATALIFIVCGARVIVKLTPTPADDSALEAVINFLKHVGLHIPANDEGRMQNAEVKAAAKPDAPADGPGKLISFVILASSFLLLTGCVRTEFRLADGTSFKTTRFAWQGDIAHAQLGMSNGVSASIDAYKSDAAALAGAIAEGVAKGLKP
jgi:hypothetical protein